MTQSPTGTKPTMGMVLAAGLGTRMRPITHHTPKPLIKVGGVTMLDRVLDHMRAVGVAECVVNVHHLAANIRAHLAHRAGGPRTLISDETQKLLETGGGVREALPMLGSAPFFVANADIIWTDGPAAPALDRLAAAWDPKRMDALLLLAPVESAHGYDGQGDFFLGDGGRITGRRGEADSAPYLYAGVQILKPDVFRGAPGGAWSMNLVFSRLLKMGRLYGLVHDGGWYHVGTPKDIKPTEALLAESVQLDQGA